jgi:hypothetical protein
MTHPPAGKPRPETTVAAVICASSTLAMLVSVLVLQRRRDISIH